MKETQSSTYKALTTATFIFNQSRSSITLYCLMTYHKGQKVTILSLKVNLNPKEKKKIHPQLSLPLRPLSLLPSFFCFSSS